MASVNVRIRPEGGREVRGALLGIVKDSARARAAVQAQARAQAQAQAAAARQAASARTSAERQSLRDVGLALRRSFQELREIERDKRREIEATAAARKKAEERAARDSARLAQRNNRFGGRFAGMALGATGIVGGLVASQIDRAQNALGVKSPDQYYAELAPNRLTFMRQSIQAGMSREDRAAAEGRLRQIASETDVPLGELYQSAASSQGRFSNLSDFLDQLGELARISMAFGSSMTDLQGVTGELNRQFGLTGEQAVEATYGIMAAAQAGSMEARDFSENFAEVMGTYTRMRGTRGRNAGGVADFSAAAQVIASQGISGEMARTQMLQFMSQISKKDVRRRLSRAHVEVLDARGNMRSFADIARQASRSPEIAADPTLLSNIFPEAWAARAMGSLIDSEKRGRGVSYIASHGPELGRQTVDTFYQEFRADPLGQDAATRTAREVGVAAQFGSMSQSFHAIADSATELGTQFPILSGVAGDLTNALQSAATAAIGFGSMSGTMTGLGASGAAAVAALGRFGPAVAAVGTGLAWVAGTLGAAGLGWGAGRLIARGLGSDEKLGDSAWYMFGRSRGAEDFHDAIRDGWRGLTGQPTGAARVAAQGGGGGPQRVTGTVALDPESIAAIRAGAGPEPGEGRRQPGGAERRP